MALSQSDKIERYKIGLDYLKHLTTLSTGSIILIAAFLEKLFQKPLWKLVVVISLIGFMMSVLSSTVSYTIIMAYDFPGEWEKEKIPAWTDVIGGLAVLTAWIGFLIGILCLAVFAIKISYSRLCSY